MGVTFVLVLVIPLQYAVLAGAAIRVLKYIYLSSLDVRVKQVVLDGDGLPERRTARGAGRATGSPYSTSTAASSSPRHPRSKARCPPSAGRTAPWSCCAPRARHPAQRHHRADPRLRRRARGRRRAALPRRRRARDGGPAAAHRRAAAARAGRCRAGHRRAYGACVARSSAGGRGSRHTARTAARSQRRLTAGPPVLRPGRVAPRESVRVGRGLRSGCSPHQSSGPVSEKSRGGLGGTAAFAFVVRRTDLHLGVLAGRPVVLDSLRELGPPGARRTCRSVHSDTPFCAADPWPAPRVRRGRHARPVAETYSRERTLQSRPARHPAPLRGLPPSRLSAALSTPSRAVGRGLEPDVLALPVVEDFSVRSTFQVSVPAMPSMPRGPR